MDSSLARRVWTAVEPYHAVVYFAPETAAAAKEVGLKGYWMGYFASRAAPMGPVAPPVVTATFFNFHPRLVERALPDAWSLASPEAVLAARLNSTDAALHRVLPDHIGSDDLREATAAAVEAAQTCVTAGRPLAAAWQAVPVPVETHMALWWASAVLREQRGDGHVAALVDAGLDGCEALITAAPRMGASGREVLQGSRGWTDDEWAAGIDRLMGRGLIDAAGALTDGGRQLRKDIERRTDELATGAYDALGESRTERLAELMEPVAAAVAAAGGIPWPNPMGVGRREG